MWSCISGWGQAAFLTGVCLCVAAPHWQHVWKGGECLSLVSVVRTLVPASLCPGWSSSCTSCPSSSPRCTAPTCCPQSPQVRHYTSPSLSYCLQGSHNHKILEKFTLFSMPGKVTVLFKSFGSLMLTKSAFTWSKTRLKLWKLVCAIK